MRATCLVLLFFGVTGCGRADDGPKPAVPSIRGGVVGATPALSPAGKKLAPFKKTVIVNTQKSLAEIVGEGFRDETWEYPWNLLPADLPSLDHVSGGSKDPGDGKGVWRRPVVYTQKATGVLVALNCFRRKEKPLELVGGNNSQPFTPEYEPNYAYQVVEFHDLKAAAASDENDEVFVFHKGDILYKVVATKGDANARKNVVHAVVEEIWQVKPFATEKPPAQPERSKQPQTISTPPSEPRRIP